VRGRTALFMSGYLSIWLVFAAAATTLQWALDRAGLLSETMAFGNIILAGSVLVAAGVYQWTPLKEACLRHCRSPLDFLLFHWRDSARGAVASGIRHGLFCLGCCWMLMALLFVGGIMNLVWIAGIALLVLIEKTLPWGRRVSQVIGVVLVAWGAVTLATAA
jgi:predicted metal-binding membrane protein